MQTRQRPSAEDIENSRKVQRFVGRQVTKTLADAIKETLKQNR